MFAFHYDPTTGAYAGSEPCEFDQREPGRKLLPAWSTEVPPPRFNTATHQACWTGEAWEIRALPPIEEAIAEATQEMTAEERAAWLRASLADQLTSAQKIIDELAKVARE